MKLLLDTHVWLWLRGESKKVPPKLRASIADLDNTVCFSAVCAWEIATKHALGKLVLPSTADDFVTGCIRWAGAQSLPIDVRHATRAGQLPPLHRDPFDRLLVAQAQADGLVLVTDDAQMVAYDVKVMWR